MVRIININWIILIFGQLCILTVTRAFHETVIVKIKNGNEIIELNLKRTGQYLANKNLPVWYAMKNTEPRLATHALSKLGQFITYHDIEKSTAVVFCTSIQRFHGIIDTRFYMVRLPLNPDPDIYYDVGGDYVKAFNDDENYFHNSHENWLQNLFSDDEIKYINSVIAHTDAEPVPGPTSQPQYQEQLDYNLPSTSAQGKPLGESQGIYENPHSPKSKTLYPEILVFITRDVIESFRQNNRENAISYLVLYYVIYFNAIDMLFAKLATDDIAIHINIAGLVLESEPGVFLYNLQRRFEPHSRKVTMHLHDNGILHNVSEYIYKCKHLFVEDSFDFFFISTGHQIRSNTETFQGKSTYPIDVFMQRVKRSHDFLPGSVVHRKVSLFDYVVATRQIAQLMNIKPDLTDEGLIVTNKRCHSIMQNTRTHCRHCLTWTKKNKRELETYVRSNVNHCFLLNPPRSIHPYGQPRVTISPEDQCMCYNYPRETLNPFYIASIPAENCDKRMQCSYLPNFEKSAPEPIDGTPCGDSNKVCWRKTCLDVQSHNIHNSDGNCHQKVSRKRPADSRK